jgi:HSP20 family protein
LEFLGLVEGTEVSVELDSERRQIVIAPLEAAVPGVDPKDIEITIDGDTLTIKGEFKQEEKVEQGSYVRQERRFGQFCRELSLPTQVNADKAKAEFEHGVLTLRLPKAEAVKPKSITVKAK